ncbi:MerR family transcriptional regulator [Paenibacillus humicola]|uniref:MerR family transcriptional regulator n=1 Tax=Paenibacillus humicola TaxID=3110540 RepID=UPI00237BDDFF|nr:MerR family transcriptional regulator [Paenibacillus humicola]
MESKRFAMEEVTERLGVTARTLHYYEEIGLLAGVERTAGGHRLYSEEIVLELEHILRLKNVLGCSLQEIRSILEAERQLTEIRHFYQLAETSEEGRGELLSRASELLGQQIRLIDDKVRGMLEMKERFERRLSRVNEIRGGGSSKSNGE